MMSDLFSSLDGGSYSSMWFLSSIFFLMMLFNKSYYASTFSILFLPLAALWSKPSKKPLVGLNLYLYSLMLIVVLNNLTGLSPFTYGNTSSLWFNSSMAVLMWLSLILAGWTYSPLSAAAHLCPAGAPALLIPFLILIETISLLIRPLTLTVRLVANISAGHIVMALIATTLSNLTSFLSVTILMLLMSAYMLFEVFVSLIQAYIFTLLLSLYAEEHP